MDNAASARSAKAQQAAAVQAGPGVRPMRWWFVLQGIDVTTVKGTEPPSLKVEKGERRKRIIATAQDEEAANKVAARLSKRVLGTVSVGGA